MSASIGTGTLESTHLLGLRHTSAADIQLILDTAEGMQEILSRQIKKAPTLRGRSVVTLFYEPSTRTRTSFEMAAKILSADTTSIAAGSSSIVKGETLMDTVLTLRSMTMDALIIRHSQTGAPALAAQFAGCPVINAGDGFNEHPTQGLLDLLTIRQRFGRVQGLTVTIVGDIQHSRVARSNLWALRRLGAVVRLAGPPTLIPPEMECDGVTLHYQVDEALEGADVVMALRIQKERQESGLFPSLREYHRLYGISAERMLLASPRAIVLHPGPMNRGVEIDPDVADGPQSAITDQVTNGVAVRMALLYLILGGKSSDALAA
ncbi:MAG TPA: aspartate carbamoyltransferase catalytic subunit [Armatimonadota bacterium]|nr:aspartate carbamoyltransferase catalytic subunit [Armatimonadota bacterium]